MERKRLEEDKKQEEKLRQQLDERLRAAKANVSCDSQISGYLLRNNPSRYTLDFVGTLIRTCIFLPCRQLVLVQLKNVSQVQTLLEHLATCVLFKFMEVVKEPFIFSTSFLFNQNPNNRPESSPIHGGGTAARSSSPPIPTLQKKVDGRKRSKSPPIPTLQNQSRPDSPPIPSLQNEVRFISIKLNSSTYTILAVPLGYITSQRLHTFSHQC